MQHREDHRTGASGGKRQHTDHDRYSFAHRRSLVNATPIEVFVVNPPQHKHSDRVALETILTERRNLAFAGTLVTSGQAEGLVWATGDSTETGRIARLVQEAVVLETPLTRKIAHFSKVLLWAILGLAAITFGIGVMRGGSIEEMFLASVALAVGAIPEGLPAAVTITWLLSKS